MLLILAFCANLPIRAHFRRRRSRRVMNQCSRARADWSGVRGGLMVLRREQQNLHIEPKVFVVSVL
jgi:hypothetical protein